jgi:hypothetical protein
VSDPLEHLVAGWVDLFYRDPESRVIMAAARRAGIPLSHARLLWQSLDDIAAEIAWDSIDAIHQFHRCPQCGVDPDDMLDERGRPLHEPRWQVTGYDCLACEMIDGATAKLSDEERKTRRYRLVPRPPGEPRFVP